MMPMAASVLRAARAKFWASISSASSRRTSQPRRMASLIMAMANVAALASRPARSFDRCLELLRWHSVVDPPHSLGLPRPQARRLDDVTGRARLADEPRQPLRAAGAGDDPERRLRLADARAPVLDHDPEVTAQRQLAAAAERVAVDGRDDRLGAALDGGEVV